MPQKTCMANNETLQGGVTERELIDLPANALFSGFVIFAVLLEKCLLEKRAENVNIDEADRFIIEEIEKKQFYIFNLC
jgi:hypothetical protein